MSAITQLMSMFSANAGGGGVVTPPPTGLDMSIYLTGSNEIYVPNAGQSNSHKGFVPSATKTVSVGVAGQFNGTTISDYTSNSTSGTGNNLGVGQIYFAEKLNELKGYKVVLQQLAKFGTSMTVAADSGAGNWSSAGTLRQTLFDNLTAWKTLTGKEPFGVRWCQGEQDADQIGVSGQTANDYKVAMQNFIDAFQTLFPSTFLFITQIATRNNYTAYFDNNNFRQIRAMQDELVAENNSFVRYTYKDAKSFQMRGMHRDNAHWVDAGYIEDDQTSAINVDRIIDGLTEINIEAIDPSTLNPLAGFSFGNLVNLSPVGSPATASFNGNNAYNLDGTNGFQIIAGNTSDRKSITVIAALQQSEGDDLIKIDSEFELKMNSGDSGANNLFKWNGSYTSFGAGTNLAHFTAYLLDNSLSASRAKRLTEMGQVGQNNLFSAGGLTIDSSLTIGVGVCQAVTPEIWVFDSALDLLTIFKALEYLHNKY